MGAFGSYGTMNQSPRTLLHLPVVSELSVRSCIEIQVVRLHPGLWNDSLLDDIPVICDLISLPRKLILLFCMKGFGDYCSG